MENTDRMQYNDKLCKIVINVREWEGKGLWKVKEQRERK